MSMQTAIMSIESVLKNVSSLECMTFALTRAAKPEVYWDARKRVCSETLNVGAPEAPVVVFTFTLCEDVTESHCMSATEGTVEGGERIFGAVPFSECQELCRAATTCDTAAWRDNVCTINSNHKKGTGTKIILKNPNCKGRRPTVIRLFRHVRGADKVNGVSDISACMRLKSKKRCSLVDFDTNDQSCWCMEGGRGRDIHESNTVVQFVPEMAFQDNGEVIYTTPVSGSMKCGFTVPCKVLESSCQSLCSGLANCIAYSHNSKFQACTIHFYLCRRTDDGGFTLKLVEFSKKLHHGSSTRTGLTNGQARFSCFVKMKRSPSSVNSPTAPYVVSKRACAVACSQQKGCLGFTYNNVNQKCATSPKAKETYNIRACWL